MSRFVSIFALLAMLIAACYTPTAEAAGLRIDDIRYGFNSGKLRVVLELNGAASYRTFLLATPNRLVLDLPRAEWKISRTRMINNDYLAAYRSGDLDGGLTRVIFDLRQPLVVTNAFALPAESGAKDRVVIDLSPASQNVFNARTQEVYGTRSLETSKSAASKTALPVTKSVLAQPQSYRESRNAAVSAAEPALLPLRKPASPTAPAPAPEGKGKKYTIVIDAGHGGEDPGAIAKDGTYEKHITLAAARALKAKLEETGRYRVVLSRSQDVYIRLRDRVDLARKAQGDLFISLHADKIDRPSVTGASIYTLSEKASDAETERLAVQENNAGVVAGVDLSEETAEVADILLDLAMREKMNESNLLAKYVEEGLRRKKVRLLPNSHRAAGFAVLKAPDIPALLIEMGFLSNADEAKLLNSSAFRDKLSDALLEGIDAYFRKIQALQKI